ncbi:hypothetical protein ABE493_00710 [Stenotrophomonas terrae]|uniref:DUF6923 family protein n=1 Tax=Stenotrophomonas terrae TaxID=405446 RepID=UPI003208324A
MPTAISMTSLSTSFGISFMHKMKKAAGCHDDGDGWRADRLRDDMPGGSGQCAKMQASKRGRWALWMLGALLSIVSLSVFAAPLPLGACPAEPLLYRDGELHSMNLLTGATNPIGRLTSAQEFNAIGFRKQDGYVYMWAVTLNGGGTKNRRLVRVGQGAVSDLPFATAPTGWPKEPNGDSMSTVVADIAPDGLYVALPFNLNTLYFVDVVTNRVDHSVPLKGVSETLMVRDFAFSPTDGMLYAVNGGTGHPWRINPVTGQVTVLTGISLPVGTSNVGAVFFDGAGTMYAYDNSGIIYRVFNVDGSGTLAYDVLTSNAAKTNNVDGAACPNLAPVGPPAIKVSKTTIGGVGGPFTFDLTGTTTVGASVSTVTAGVPVMLDADSKTPGTQLFKAVAIGEPITITEGTMPKGWSLASAVCTSDGVVVGTFDNDVYSIPGADAKAGGLIECDFVNTPTSLITVAKTGAQPTDNGNGTYDVVYTVTATNSGTIAGTFTATDTVTVSGAVTSVVVVNGPVRSGGTDTTNTGTLGTLTASGGAIVTNEPIGAGATDIYTYTVRYTLSGGLVDAICPATGSTAIANTVTLDNGSTARECKDLPSISVSKSLTQINGAAVAPGATTSAGDTLTYTITVNNAGTAAATNHAFYESIPAYTLFQSATGAAVSQCAPNDAGRRSCTLSVPSVPAKSSATVTLTVKVADELPNGLTALYNLVTDSACAAGDATCAPPPACDPATDANQCRLPPPNCDAAADPMHCNKTPVAILTTAKTSIPANGASVSVGDTITYTLTVTVAGDSSARTPVAAELVDTMTGLTLEPGSIVVPPNGTCDTSAGLTCTLASGAGVGTYEFKYQAKVNAGVTSVRNAVVGGGCATGDPDCTTENPIPAVTVKKTSDIGTGTAVRRGDVIAYTLAVNVTDAQTVTPVVLSDTLGAGLTLTGPLPAGCTATANGLSCTLATGTAIGQYTFQYRATVANDATIKVVNTVTPSGASCPVAEDCTTENPIPAVTVKKTSDVGTGAAVKRGDVIAYTLTVNVTDAQTVTPVVLGDTLGAGLTLTGPLPAGCTATASGLSCTLATGTAIGQYTFQYRATVANDATVKVVNTVMPSGASCPVAADCTTDNPMANVMVAKSLTQIDGVNVAADAQVKAGDELTYTITVTNSGAAAANNHQFYESIPAYTTFQSATGASVVGCNPGDSGRRTCTLTVANVPANGNAMVMVRLKVADVVPLGLTTLYNVVTDNVCAANDAACTPPPACDPATDTNRCVSPPLGCNPVTDPQHCVPSKTLHPELTVTKSMVGQPTVVAGALDQFDLVYAIKVENTGNAPGVYELRDTFGFDQSVKVESVALVTHEGPDPLFSTINAGFNGVGDTLVTQSETIAANSSEIYTVKLRVSIGMQQGGSSNATCDAGAGAGHGLFNEAVVQYDGKRTAKDDACGDTPQPRVVGDLVIEKVGSVREAELGDMVTYTLRVKANGNYAVDQPVVVDSLPRGFRLIDGTVRVRTGTLVELTGAPGPVLRMTLGRIEPAQEITISYRVRLGVGSQEGSGINRALVTCPAYGDRGAGQCSNEATWKVEVRGGVFSEMGGVIGKVFVDCNLNSVQDKEELGIPGVRLYFDNGTFLVSDVEGKYSFFGLTPQTHMLKVDARTLPMGSRLMTSSSRNAGDANSLFIDIKAGEMQRADFIEGSCSNRVLEQVKARRASGEVRSIETETGQPGLRFESKPLTAPQQATDSANQTIEMSRYGKGGMRSDGN